jgi:hypothetical protein
MFSSGKSSRKTLIANLLATALGCLLVTWTLGCSWNLQGEGFNMKVSQAETDRVVAPASTATPWHSNILATCFWVGEPGNAASAWDPNWVKNFGGVDHPEKRSGWRPGAFRPRLNTFYCALPFNDVAGQPNRKSKMQGRWIEVRAGGKSCFCSWQDVGPWHTNDRQYVLGTARPRAEKRNKAGIDLSPAVKDYLGLSGMDTVDWRFVEKVPAGPWKHTDSLTALRHRK